VDVEDGSKYIIVQDGKTQELPLKKIDSEEYDFAFDGLNLAPGTSVTISYKGKANPIDLGKIMVGIFDPSDEY